MDIKAEYNAPRVTEETWTVRVNGKLVGIVREKEAADLINGAEACREALRVCLDAGDAVLSAWEGGDLAAAVRDLSEALNEARLALGLEVSE